HDAGGISNTPFLAGPDRYRTITSWPGIVARDPSKSLLLTHPVAGGKHSGTNIDSDALKTTLLPEVQGWLAEEAAEVGAPASEAGPTIDPFSPILGFNAVYLDALGQQYAGMALTFNADELTHTTLELKELEVHPTAKLGVHVVHPLFVVYHDGEP